MIVPIINRIFVIFLGVMLIPSLALGAGNIYYVDSTDQGLADGSSPANAYSFDDAWNDVGAGDTIIATARAAAYQGSANMIDPPENLNGTAAAPIWVIGETYTHPDGPQLTGVTIDGQKARRPIDLLENDYWIIEGFNCKNGNNKVINLGDGSDYNILRRVGAWETDDTNSHVFSLDEGDNNTLEDCFGFGRGRKIFAAGASHGNDNTFRRCFGYWNKNESATGPEMTLTMFYNNYRMTVENVVMTWDTEDNKTTSQQYGCIGNDGASGGYNYETDSQLLGSIAFVESGADFPAWAGVFHTKIGAYTIDNVAVFMGRSGTRGFSLNAACPPAGSHSSCAGKTADTKPTAKNTTSIGDTDDYFHHNWLGSDREHGATVNDVESIWTSDTGARICQRYKDGTLGSDALWPWPMDDNIYAAMSYAGTENQYYVTAKLESLFGSIPQSACRDDYAYSESPVDGATQVSPDVDIEWTLPTGWGSGVSCDVLFNVGDTANTYVLTNSTATSYDPGTLLDDTTYSYRIDIKHIKGGVSETTTTGDDITFTTGESPPPEGGQGSGGKWDYSPKGGHNQDNRRGGTVG